MKITGQILIWKITSDYIDLLSCSCEARDSRYMSNNKRFFTSRHKLIEAVVSKISITPISIHVAREALNSLNYVPAGKKLGSIE